MKRTLSITPTRTNAEHCCDRMATNVEKVCEYHPDRYDCPDALVDAVRGGYGLMIHSDGGDSVIEIAFCPWCGTKLPPIADLSEEELEANERREHRPVAHVTLQAHHTNRQTAVFVRLPPDGSTHRASD